MSLIGDIVGTVANVAVHAAIDTVCPEAEMLPALSNLATSTLGGALGDAIGQVGQQCGMPNFVINGAKDALSQVVSQLQQPVDPGSLDQVAGQAGDAVNDLVNNIINDFKDALQNYKNEQAQKGQCGGKGGANGVNGANGVSGTSGAGGASSAPIGFRELAELLAGLEQKEAQNVAQSAQKAGDALGVAKSGAKGDEQKDANIEADQFRAMEANKAEAQIFQALSSAISEVMKNFGGALQTAARG